MKRAILLTSLVLGLLLLAAIVNGVFNLQAASAQGSGGEEPYPIPYPPPFRQLIPMVLKAWGQMTSNSALLP